MFKNTYHLFTSDTSKTWFKSLISVYKHHKHSFCTQTWLIAHVNWSWHTVIAPLHHDIYSNLLNSIHKTNTTHQQTIRHIIIWITIITVSCALYYVCSDHRQIVTVIYTRFVPPTHRLTDWCTTLVFATTKQESMNKFIEHTCDSFFFDIFFSIPTQKWFMHIQIVTNHQNHSTPIFKTFQLTFSQYSNQIRFRKTVKMTDETHLIVGLGIGFSQWKMLM